MAETAQEQVAKERKPEKLTKREREGPAGPEGSCGYVPPEWYERNVERN